jgi:D-psicose/D-tagatose/L-ribulose 3-epimerase
MSKELVEKVFVAPGKSTFVEFDDRINSLMEDFLWDLVRAINKYPIEAVECYFSVALDRHRMADVLSTITKEIWSVHGPYGKFYDTSSPELESRTGAIKGCCEAVLLAKSLGAKVVVIHPGHSTAYDVPRQLRIDHSIDSIKQIADFAGEHGVKLAVEPLPNNEIGCFIEEVIEIIEKVNRPNVGVNFDTNHLYPAAAIPSLIRKVKGMIASVHISDQDDIERHWLPFLGKLDWKEVLQAFIDAGYNGPLVYETHIREAKDPDEVASIVSANYVELSKLIPESVYKN